MGKGYNNFMSKKAFHPGSYANQERVKEAEAKAEAKRKYDEETLAKYRAEQELFHQKSLVSNESKAKLSLSFMYEAPPGTSQQEDGDDEFKVDKMKWKREKGEPENSNKQGKDKGNDDDEEDDEPKLVLKWKREEPKAKKCAPESSKRVKRE